MSRSDITPRARLFQFAIGATQVASERVALMELYARAGLKVRAELDADLCHDIAKHYEVEVRESQREEKILSGLTISDKTANRAFNRGRAPLRGVSATANKVDKIAQLARALARLTTAQRTRVDTLEKKVRAAE